MQETLTSRPAPAEMPKPTSPASATAPHAPASLPESRRIRPWSLAHPLWLCPFRPFFALSILSAAGLIALWGAYLTFGWPLPDVPDGPFVWHAHELLMGFALAAAVGFVLTAVPEFTETPELPAAPVRALVLLWLAGRIAFWLSGAWPRPAMATAALAHLLLLGGLLKLIAPPIWRDRERRQLAFIGALLLMIALTAGFYFDALRGEPPARWLLAQLGAFMALIIIAMSRISMRIVNASIEERQDAEKAEQAQTAFDAEETAERYIARPPRRNMAIVCIALFTAAQWLQPGGRISAWLALATACAMLNLMGDWHVGRALWRRWPLMLYASYAAMAAGYGLTGFSLLGDGLLASGSLHLLTIGGLGLSIYAVIAIAGYTHSGLEKDDRAWVPVGACLLAASAPLRVIAAAAEAPTPWLALSAALWCAAFALMGWHMLPVFMRPRADGRSGCAGVLGKD